MLKLKIHNAKELDRNAKCTVHTSGKLGFSEGGMKRMALKPEVYVVIASNEEDPSDDNLYAWVEINDQNGGFKVCKAGEYFYLNTKTLFDELKVDYRNKDIVTIYDIIGEQYEGKSIFRLQKRIQKRSKKKKSEITDT